MTALIELLAAGRRAGLALTQKDDQLAVRGSREHERLVRALLARKPDVLACLAVYNGLVPRLDWRREPILPALKPCTLCGRSTLLIEPYDHRPAHKTCCEALIRWGTVPAADNDRSRAA